MWNAVIGKLTSPIATSLDLPGHGANPALPREATDFTSNVDVIAKSLPLSMPPILIGYSMGARIALGLALRHPDKVASAILIGVDAGIEDEAMRAERIAWDDAWADRAERESVESFATAWEKLPLFDSQQNLSADLRADLRKQRTSHAPAGIAWAMRTLGLGRMPSFWPLLEKNEVPLVLMSGALDRKFTEKSRAIVTRSKNARAVVVADVGHNVALEAPDAVAK
jgi:2-succinyl-6-hydroxy-2,4-cyclohexadiene-1-carboxylate synthase